MAPSALGAVAVRVCIRLAARPVYTTAHVAAPSDCKGRCAVPRVCVCVEDILNLSTD
jgi:hypothetical protein